MNSISNQHNDFLLRRVFPAALINPLLSAWTAEKDQACLRKLRFSAPAQTAVELPLVLWVQAST